MLPSLAERAVTVAPSARAWLRAGTLRPFGAHKTLLVSGPGLALHRRLRAAGAEPGAFIALGA